jgi:hypothetical protein
MVDRAKVTSLEALESFRASLIVYLAKAGRALDEISDEVVRTRLWVQGDRREHWEQEVRSRTKIFEEKQAELFRARLSVLQPATQAEQAAALKARRALEEAEARLSHVRKWSRAYESRVEPLAKEVDRLRDFLAAHMGKAVHSLNKTIKHLGEYAEVGRPPSAVIEGPPGLAAADSAAATPPVERRLP